MECQLRQGQRNIQVKQQLLTRDAAGHLQSRDNWAAGQCFEAPVERRISALRRQARGNQGLCPALSNDVMIKGFRKTQSTTFYLQIPNQGRFWGCIYISLERLRTRDTATRFPRS